MLFTVLQSCADLSQSHFRLMKETEHVVLETQEDLLRFFLPLKLGLKIADFVR